MTINYEPTADAIRKAAEVARDLCDALNHFASKCVIEQDLTYASEAVGAIANANLAFRVDLMLMRPIRELNKEVIRLKEQAQ